jgi:membrane-bound lytic murein transglycosylase B
MPTRRFLLAAAPAALAAGARASTAQAASKAAIPGSFRDFLTGVRAEARRAGIASATLDRAFAGVSPNQKVLDRDRHQPEFTMTWARYRALVITDKRIVDGRQAVAANRGLFQRVQTRFGVGPGVIAGIWGLESSFGTGTGDFHVVESLATLGWEGRRAGFFRGELLAALKILDHGDVVPAAMTGSYAGAMGQPQFMPSSYLRYAVDFDGHGRRDIWTSKPDVLGSIANYLAQSGWRDGQTWGQEVSLPPGLDATGRDSKRPLADWARAGVRPLSGRWVSSLDTPAGIVSPDGAAGESFAVFGNFAAIRRYNPSDYYAIAVGLIGDQVTG